MDLNFIAKPNHNGGGRLLDLASISADPRVEEAIKQEEKLKLQDSEAAARLRKDQAALQAAMEKAADRLSQGKATGDGVEKARSKVAQAESDFRITELAVQRAKERKNETIKAVRMELEEALRSEFGRAVTNLDASLSEAAEKNQAVLDIFNVAQRLFGQNQNIIHQLHWQELLTDQRANVKLQAWRDYVSKENIRID